MKRHFIAAAFVAVLCGCTSKSAQMLDDRRMSISYLGNTYSSTTDVTREVLHTAALEGQKRGFAYFHVTQAADATRSGMVALPTTTNSYGTASASCFGGYCSGNANSNSTTYGGGLVNVVRPGADVQVRFYRDGEIQVDTPGLWSIAAILANS